MAKLRGHAILSERFPPHSCRSVPGWAWLKTVNSPFFTIETDLISFSEEGITCIIADFSGLKKLLSALTSPAADRSDLLAAQQPAAPVINSTLSTLIAVSLWHLAEYPFYFKAFHKKCRACCFKCRRSPCIFQTDTQIVCCLPRS